MGMLVVSYIVVLHPARRTFVVVFFLSVPFLSVDNFRLVNCARLSLAIITAAESLPFRSYRMGLAGLILQVRFACSYFTDN